MMHLKDVQLHTNTGCGKLAKVPDCTKNLELVTCVACLKGVRERCGETVKYVVRVQVLVNKALQRAKALAEE